MIWNLLHTFNFFYNLLCVDKAAEPIEQDVEISESDEQLKLKLEPGGTC